MDCAVTLNTFGLMLDIVGAIMLWKYGLPESVNRGGVIYRSIAQTDEKEKRKAEKYDMYAKLGLGLLISGFALQLVSNFIE